jgi:predicted transposase YdaD
VFVSCVTLPEVFQEGPEEGPENGPEEGLQEGLQEGSAERKRTTGSVDARGARVD